MILDKPFRFWITIRDTTLCWQWIATQSAEAVTELMRRAGLTVVHLKRYRRHFDRVLSGSPKPHKKRRRGHRE